ncbi:MAG: acylneuraminate cytidylyltransferase family protein [Acidimicrobiia bacterium]|nr:acylneuraminate cytidylyltransferase family protein [Acidimicrobiia bacterium]NNF70253.1 acylneuraminate cytidylyltransferase family protein [Acidimicrobiia bacterium]NNK91958.1 acylneuraminate cytidylyltransferase family protein [Acidimicrobiia bacterium]
MTRLLGVVPARAGSRRLPGKNTRELGGIPMIGWTLRAAVASQCLDALVVSTDSPDIAAVAEAFGVPVPRLRGEGLATDDAAVADVIVDALSWFEDDYDAVVVLQPSSPFRRPETIQSVIETYESEPGVSVVTVGPVEKPIAWLRRLTDAGELADPGLSAPDGLRRLNGSMYVAPAKHLIDTRSLYTTPTRGFAMDDPIESLDIDTPADWLLAERCADHREAP